MLLIRWHFYHNSTLTKAQVDPYPSISNAGASQFCRELYSPVTQKPGFSCETGFQHEKVRCFLSLPIILTLTCGAMGSAGVCGDRIICNFHLQTPTQANGLLTEAIAQLHPLIDEIIFIHQGFVLFVFENSENINYCGVVKVANKE